jgi:transcriptional regulator with XRE-family HTH domain
LEAGLTIEALAEKIEISRRQLQRIFSGKSIPRRSTITAIAKALNTHISNLTSCLPYASDITHFSLDLSIQGQLDDPDQFSLVATIISDTVQRLKTAGVDVKGAQSNLISYEQDHLVRVLCVAYGVLENGNPFWVCVAVKPSRYLDFRNAQRQNTLDLYSFKEYGEIVVSGEGERPPDEIMRKVAETYKCDPTTMFRPLDIDAEVGRLTHRALAERKDKGGHGNP